MMKWASLYISKRGAALALVAGLVASVGGLFLFAWIAEEVFSSEAVNFDNTVRLWAHSYASSGFTSVMFAFTALGSVALLTTLGLCFLIMMWKGGWRDAARLFALSMGGALLLNLALKFAFHRARPIPFFGVAPHSFSFPSGHAMLSACFYGTLAAIASARLPHAYSRVMIWLAAILLVGAIGFSRIYLGVHYPSDVAAGYIAAVCWLSVLALVRKFRAPAAAKDLAPAN